MEYVAKPLWVHRDPKDRLLWQQFLEKSEIMGEDTTDFTLGVFDNECLVATGSLFENIIKCIAILPEYQGGEMFHGLLSQLEAEVHARGHHSIYIYTKSEAMRSFEQLGFKLIAAVSDKLVFLEKCVNGFSEYLAKLEQQNMGEARVGAIVMNANPFTLGHRYLIEYGAQRCDKLYVFVLSENLSEFSSSVRFDLVKRGTQDIENVVVEQTGDYMVSAKTFPSYFLKESDDITSIQAQLDAAVFLKIAHALGISKRFVGEEPFSHKTDIYNKAMQKIFSQHIGIEIIPRKKVLNVPISASRVRALLSQGDIQSTKSLVPETTYQFLLSKEGQSLIKNTKNRKE